MKWYIIIPLLTLIAMSSILVYGFIIGDFASDGREILTNPWGLVSLVDLYAGFILFSLWIVYREKSLIVTIIWVVLMMTLGFWTGSLYVLVEAVKTKGNLVHLLLGSHYQGQQKV